jgi:hypothetical protein
MFKLIISCEQQQKLISDFLQNDNFGAIFSQAMQEILLCFSDTSDILSKIKSCIDMDSRGDEKKTDF